MFTQYLLGILAVCLMAVVVELILPENEMAKYIKGIFAFVFIFVIISPIPKILSLDFSMQDLVKTSKATKVDDNFLNMLNTSKKDELEKNVFNLLEQHGFYDVDVLITTKNDGFLMKLDKVYIDLTNSVLKKENQHINKYTTIKDLLTTHTQIIEEQIVFYG